MSAALPAEAFDPQGLLFAHMVRRPEDEIDLAVASLLVAESEYPGLDLAKYRSKLDRMGETVIARIRERESQVGPHGGLLALNEYLFAVEGFHGNREDYYDPRNSFLSDVMDRRTGVPISLSIVYLEVAWRVGLNVQGIGFPGHFLIRYAAKEGVAVLDTFDAGRILDKKELAARLRAVAGDEVQLGPQHIAPATKRQILARLLTNLRMIYDRQQDHRRTLSVVEKLAILNPDDEPLLEERAALRRRVADVN